MKIELEIPDWASESKLYIMSGFELVAYKEADKTSWFVKEGRCSYCGECCIHENVPCESLYEKEKGVYLCQRGLGRPFHCSVYICPDSSICTQSFKETSENTLL